MDTPLIAALQDWASRDHAPFYTPGHKQGRGMGLSFRELWQGYGLTADLPELPGLDNLAAPQGVIQSAQELAAQTFGAEFTRFLVNGSSAGIMAAILAVCGPGDQILLPRNIHRSVVAGLIHSGAQPIYLQPEYLPSLDIAHSLDPALVEIALAQYPKVRAILVVSPTYYGAAGDIQRLAAIAHHHGIPLVVDGAHGAHFGFHPQLPPSPLALGADLVIQSSHKTLGALTQAAMIHGQGHRIDRARLDRSLQLVQTTSPSYLLLASLDSARAQLDTMGFELWEQALALATRTRHTLLEVSGLWPLDFTSCPSPGCHSFDLTRLTVTVTEVGWTGYEADGVLSDRYRVVAEMPSWRHLTFIISPGNRDWDGEMLVAGLRGLAQADRFPLELPEVELVSKPISTPPCSPRRAFFAPTATVPIESAGGRLAAELVCPYPPGIPLLIPGELITPETVAALQETIAAGGEVVGCSDPHLGTLQVLEGYELGTANL